VLFENIRPSTSIGKYLMRSSGFGIITDLRCDNYGFMGMFVTGLANKVERNINKKLWEMVLRFGIGGDSLI